MAVYPKTPPTKLGKALNAWPFRHIVRCAAACLFAYFKRILPNRVLGTTLIQVGMVGQYGAESFQVCVAFFARPV